MKHLPPGMSRWTLQSASCWCLSSTCLHCWLLEIFKMVTWNWLTKISYSNFLEHMFHFFVISSFNVLVPDERLCQMRQQDIVESPMMLTYLIRGKWYNKICQELVQALNIILKANRQQQKPACRDRMMLPMLSRKGTSPWWLIINFTKLRPTQWIKTSMIFFS